MTNTNPSSHFVLQKLRALKPQFKDMNIKRLRVFGSHARGEASPDSDVDLLVEFYETPDLWTFAELQEELSHYLQMKVDLATSGFFKHPVVRQSVMEDVIDV